MPKLEDLRKIINVKLPSNPEVEIVMKDGILAGDFEDIDKVASKYEQSILMVQKMIKSWNFNEDDGKMTPVTVENLKKLSVADINFLLEQTTFMKDFLAQRGKPNKI